MAERNDATQKRLEELRAAIRAENISYGELYELQGLAEHIDPGDVELLEWAGVPEFPDDDFVDVEVPVRILFRVPRRDDVEAVGQLETFVENLFENGSIREAFQTALESSDSLGTVEYDGYGVGTPEVTNS